MKNNNSHQNNEIAKGGDNNPSYKSHLHERQEKKIQVSRPTYPKVQQSRSLTKNTFKGTPVRQMPSTISAQQNNTPKFKKIPAMSIEKVKHHQQQNIGLNIHDNQPEDYYLFHQQQQYLQKIADLQRKLQMKEKQNQKLKRDLQKSRGLVSNLRIQLSRQKQKKSQKQQKGVDAIEKPKRTYQHNNNSYMHNNNNNNNNNNSINKNNNQQPPRVYCNQKKKNNNDQTLDEEQAYVMAQIAAIERGENPDEFLAKDIYQRDMKRMKKKMNQFQLEYAQRQQLKQIMEESKKQAMNDAGIMNEDMTYEEMLELTQKAGKVSRGLTYDQIEKTLSQYYHDGREELGSCTVCMSDIVKGQTYRLLPCLHSFHIFCIDEWLKLEKTCPTCKEQIVPIVSESQFQY